MGEADFHGAIAPTMRLFDVAQETLILDSAISTERSTLFFDPVWRTDHRLRTHNLGCPAHKHSKTARGTGMIALAPPAPSPQFKPAQQVFLPCAARSPPAIGEKETQAVLKRNPRKRKTVQLNQISLPQRLGQPWPIMPGTVIVHKVKFESPVLSVRNKQV